MKDIFRIPSPNTDAPIDIRCCTKCSDEVIMHTSCSISGRSASSNIAVNKSWNSPIPTDIIRICLKFILVRTSADIAVTFAQPALWDERLKRKKNVFCFFFPWKNTYVRNRGHNASDWTQEMRLNRWEDDDVFHHLLLATAVTGAGVITLGRETLRRAGSIPECWRNYKYKNVAAELRRTKSQSDILLTGREFHGFLTSLG